MTESKEEAFLELKEVFKKNIDKTTSFEELNSLMIDFMLVNAALNLVYNDKDVNINGNNKK